MLEIWLLMVLEISCYICMQEKYHIWVVFKEYKKLTCFGVSYILVQNLLVVGSGFVYQHCNLKVYQQLKRIVRRCYHYNYTSNNLIWLDGFFVDGNSIGDILRFNT
jgi:hypothetical protein